MTNKLFYTLFLILISFFYASVKAVPAYPRPIVVTQPDGSTVTVQLRGDESRKIRTTVDGYIIKKNQSGYYTYAEPDGANRYVAGKTIARDPERRPVSDQVYLNKIKKYNELGSQSYSGVSRIKRAPSATTASTGFPRTGSPKSLVILVNFSDVSFSVSNPQNAFYRLLNQENYSDNSATGSVNDYFKAASNGQFNPQFDVVGPYKLNNTMAYYGANDATTGDDVKPAYMIVDACKAAKDAGLNFAQYDTDNDGYIDNVFVYYAGYNEAEWGPENSVWPHRWAVSPGDNFTNNQSLVKFDGKIVYDYACTSELKGSTGLNMCGIGTFTHEFGHVIGLPDYYHTETDKNTVNDWSIMDAGAYLNDGRTPPTYSAYDRFFLGWLTPQELNTPSDKALLPLSQSKVSLASTSKQAYLLAATTHNLVGDNPSPKEFYVMEYRKKSGWDSYLPAEGLLFWHIDYNQTAWDNNEPNNYTGTNQTASSHMRMYLQPLSGYTTTPGTAFTSGSFDPLTWAGSRIDRAITGITKTSDSISFKIMGGSVVNPVETPRILAGVINGTLQFPVIASGAETAKTLNIRTTDISGDLTLTVNGANAALFSASVQSISMTAANSASGVNIIITYKPLAGGAHTAILTISGGGLTPEKIIELRGSATE
ncbi:MAG: M6 family metalloprotease domain-containing protein [Paludibacter sp.]|nr:M6 family metalloprotease domain-containing protein [Paludibacter sp.]